MAKIDADKNQSNATLLWATVLVLLLLAKFAPSSLYKMFGDSRNEISQVAPMATPGAASQ